MAWNASVAALNDRTQPREALRVKAQREYFALGKDFLERGIRNNPDRPQLYERSRVFTATSITITKMHRTTTLRPRNVRVRPVMKKDSPPTSFLIAKDARDEAYERLHELYLAGENERLPTLITRLKYLETKLGIPLRINAFPTQHPPTH